MAFVGRCICHMRALAPNVVFNQTWRATVVRLPAERGYKIEATSFQAGDLRKGGRRAVTGSRSQRPESISICHATAQAEEPKQKINSKEEDGPGGVKRFTITVPAAAVGKAWQKAIKMESRSHDFPGFRQGKKIPEALVMQRVGKEAVVQRAIEIIITDALPLATEKYAETAYDESLQVDAVDDLVANFNKEKDFSFKCSITLQPELKWKGDYKKLKLELEPVASEDAIRERAEMRIKGSLKETGSLRIVQGRGLQTGDVAVIDFELRRKDSDEPIEGTKQVDRQFDTEASEEAVQLPGFIDDIQGMVVGDRRLLDFTIEDEAYADNLRGLQVVCDVTLKELFTWELPQLTDQVAKVLLPECKSVDELKAAVMDAERNAAQAQSMAALQNEICAKIAELVDTEIPEFLYRTVGESQYQAELLQGQSEGALTPEQVEELATEENLNQFMEMRTDDINDTVRVTLAMEDIWRREGLTLAEDEIKAEYDAVMREAQEGDQKLDEEKLQEQVIESLKGAKILDWILDQAEVTTMAPIDDADDATASEVTKVTAEPDN